MTQPAPDPIVRRIFANLARLIGGKAGAGVISLAYMVIAARELGPADYGVLILVHTFAMTVGGIVEFPGWHAIVRYGADALEQRDHDRLGRLLRFAGVIELLGGVVAVAAAAVLAPLLGARLGWSPAALAFALPYSFAVLASIRSTPAGYLQLAGRFDLLGLHTMAAPLVRLAGAGIAAMLGAGLHGFLVAWLIAALVEFVSLWAIGLWAARRALGSLPLTGSLKGVTQENDGIWQFMVGANADVTFSELAARIAPLVIGSVMGSVAVGFYSLAQRVTTVLAVPAQVLGQAAYAELARLVAAGGHGAPLRQALAKSIGIALAAAVPVVIVLVLFADRIAVAVGGAAYAGAAGLLLWLTAARTLLLIGPPASAALVALGKPSLSVAANMGAALLALPLLPLLLWRFGVVGAGGHAVIQAGVTSLLLVAFVRRRSQSLERETAAA
ncbi:MAG: lipopolysaccharide biosynthesis protein [Sphingomicrobium sp.]